MALPSSGTLRLSQVINEFNCGNSLRDFLRGGPCVPDNSANSGVPTSGTLRLRQLLGASDYTAINVTANNVSDFEQCSSNCPSSITMAVTGSAGVTGGDGSFSITWTKLSGHSAISIVSGGTTLQPRFQATVGVNSPGYTATYRCTVNDGVTSDFDDCTVSFTYNDVS